MNIATTIADKVKSALPNHSKNMFVGHDINHRKWTTPVIPSMPFHHLRWVLSNIQEPIKTSIAP